MQSSVSKKVWLAEESSFSLTPSPKSLAAKVPSIEHVYRRVGRVSSNFRFWTEPPGP